MSAPTPGPWLARAVAEDRAQVCISDPDAVVAELRGFPCRMADARLIALAPDLLAFVERWSTGEVPSVRQRPWVPVMLREAAELLARARGPS